MKQNDFIVKNLDLGVIVLSNGDSAEVQYANDAASVMQLQLHDTVSDVVSQKEDGNY